MLVATGPVPKRRVSTSPPQDLRGSEVAVRESEYMEPFTDTLPSTKAHPTLPSPDEPRSLLSRSQSSDAFLTTPTSLTLLSESASDEDEDFDEGHTYSTLTFEKPQSPSTHGYLSPPGSLEKTKRKPPTRPPPPRLGGNRQSRPLQKQHSAPEQLTHNVKLNKPAKPARPPPLPPQLVATLPSSNHQAVSSPSTTPTHSTVSPKPPPTPPAPYAHNGVTSPLRPTHPPQTVPQPKTSPGKRQGLPLPAAMAAFKQQQRLGYMTVPIIPAGEPKEKKLKSPILPHLPLLPPPVEGGGSSGVSPHEPVYGQIWTSPDDEGVPSHKPPAGDYCSPRMPCEPLVDTDHFGQFVTQKRGSSNREVGVYLSAGLRLI